MFLVEKGNMSIALDFDTDGMSAYSLMMNIKNYLEWEMFDYVPVLFMKPLGEDNYVEVGSDDEFRAIIKKHIEARSAGLKPYARVKIELI